MTQAQQSDHIKAPAYSADRPLKFDLEGAAFKRDPFPTFAAMRAAGPIVPVKVSFIGKVWMTTTHAASQAMVKDNDLFVQEGRNAGKTGKAGGAAGMQWWMPNSLRLITNNMLQKDEPDHRRLRKLVDHAFARRDILAMRASVEAAADRLLDGFEGRDVVDLSDDYARRLPIAVICELLGLPDSDRDVFSAWTQTTLRITGPLGILRALGAINKLVSYLRARIEDCRRSPRPGLIGELVRAEVEGEQLDENELLSMVFLLLIAGFETTTHLIGGAIIDLEQNPDQKAWLLADSEARMERAVEELARHVSSVQGTKPRHVARDTEFFGQHLKQGDLVMALLASANSDPAQFDHPEDLRLDRFPNPHLVFSSGIHFCLGLQLARLEVQVALGRLYARYPDLQIVAPDQLEWIERIGTRGVKALPARLNATGVRLAA